MGKVTMQMIADRCGVSKALVSRILNQDPTLRTTAETRQRVLAAVEETGYVRDLNAQALAQARNMPLTEQRRIGYVTFSSRGHVGHPYFAHIIDGIVEESSRCRVQMPFQFSIHQFREQLDSVLAGYADNPLDGIILLGTVDDPPLVSAIRKIARRVVSVDGQFDRNSDYVGVDTAQSILLALEHLVNLGYGDIGLLLGSEGRRLASCRDYLARRNMAFNEQWILNCEYSVNVAKQRVEEKLRECRPPRAIVACNDEMAIGCIKALKENGWRVPEDVAVVGHDDISLAAYVDVPLTTVRVYKKEIGRLAVKILLDRIETGRKNVVYLEIPGKLIKRESCGWKLAGNLNGGTKK